MTITTVADTHRRPSQWAPHALPFLCFHLPSLILLSPLPFWIHLFPLPSSLCYSLLPIFFSMSSLFCLLSSPSSASLFFIFCSLPSLYRVFSSLSSSSPLPSNLCNGHHIPTFSPSLTLLSSPLPSPLLFLFSSRLLPFLYSLIYPH